MAYEPKVGDEVIWRGRVLKVNDYQVSAQCLDADGEKFPYVRGFLSMELHPRHPDLGEAELRGQVSGPWAVELAEAMEKVEERLAALEASAKVRDVPATMVNLAHRVQSMEVMVKTMSEEARAREDATRAELDGVLLRVGRMESDLGMIPQQEDIANLHHRLRTVEAVLTEHLGNSPPPAPNKPRDHLHGFAGADEVRDAQGRVLKSQTQDVDPQGDWNTARVVAAPPEDTGKVATNIQLRRENKLLMADLQRAEARLDRIGVFLGRKIRSPLRDELLNMLKDPAHGDPPLSDPPANGDRPWPLGDAQ